jgi:hypothetical protein
MKDKLLVLIDAYAAARNSNNGLLLEFAATQLNAFLQGVDVVEHVSEATPVDLQSPEVA